MILAQAAGGFHSRTIENRIATANTAKTRPVLSIGQLSHRPTKQNPYPRLASGSSSFSEAHDVVAAIHVDHFTRNAAAGVGGEEDSRRPNFCDFYVAA